jgi:hypothetical protein
MNVRTVTHKAHSVLALTQPAKSINCLKRHQRVKSSRHKLSLETKSHVWKPARFHTLSPHGWTFDTTQSATDTGSLSISSSQRLSTADIVRAISWFPHRADSRITLVLVQAAVNPSNATGSSSGSWLAWYSLCSAKQLSIAIGIRRYKWRRMHG